MNHVEDKIREEELRCTVKQLAALNELKDKLFATVTHDIRNPMATMVSMMDILEEDPYSSDSREIIHEVRKQVKSTFFMVENLLKWLNNQKSRRVYRDILKIVQDTVNALQYRREAKGIRIANSMEDGVTIFTDREILGMVLQNLFNHAMKIYRSGGLISIQTQKTGQKVIVVIRDTGISIDSDDVKTLFNEVDGGFAAGKAGEKETGLGILICMEFIQSSEFEIWLDSISEEGSTFYFSLPGITK